MGEFSACLRYIDEYWSRITVNQPADQGTLIGLPRPFVCANHDMFRELYYWDSYFIILGLEHTRHEHLVVDITENMLYLMQRFGRIPNASRYYFLSRSQPPFLTSMVRKSLGVMLRNGCTDEQANQWLREASLIARNEYDLVWRGKKFPDHREVYQGLSRYYDLNIWHAAAEAESGWDMTPRFENRCLDYIPIDLNCLLYQYERDFLAICERLGEASQAAQWKQQLAMRREAINATCWCPDAGYFYDFDYARGRRSTFKSIAGFFALWSEIASPEQAERVVKQHLPTLETPYGIVTSEPWDTSRDEFSKQWGWPNGWAPLTWIAVSGLTKYGYHKEALRIAAKWVDLVNQVFLANGVNFEKYDVVHGKRAVPDRYPDQAGFGWTNGVFRRLVEFLATGKLWMDYVERRF